jgi:hypothetical protein
MRAPVPRCLTIVGVGICTTVTLLWSAGYTPSVLKAQSVRTDDRNGDGRPDVWRTYDREGLVIEQAIDSNFDGRSDVHEYYVRGALVHRESDRNFDDRIDLVEDFDATTHEHVRSVIDSDFDGTADLLVLFQGGRPVFSKWAPSAQTTAGDPVDARPGSRDLAPLTDPFTSDLTFRNTPRGEDAPDSVWTAVGLPSWPAMTERELQPAWAVRRPDASLLRTPVVGARSPRGPPLA